MTLPRSSLICVDDTPYYHCVSRCVRRAFLCGTDNYSGQCYEHRRTWLESKLKFAASVFAIRLCSYAVMSNHYHVVLHIRTDIAAQWSDSDVVKQWHTLFKGTLLSQRFTAGERLLQCEREALQPVIDRWRARLCSVSWFMKVVNEDIARRANAEDNCTGSFWESRFKSQALLDDRALLSCMAYVDLNPIRTKMAKTPEQSEFTSVKERIDALIEKRRAHESLEQMVGIKSGVIGVPFKLQEYLELVDYSGRIIREGKRGAIDQTLPHILDRLGLDQQTWHTLTTEFEEHFQQWVGSEHIVRRICQERGYQRVPNRQSQRQYLTP
ncbi:MAG: hypothetical protein KTR16_07070 [Acidiferrobacterales bacterium]|nr:hypothetical protein [Acidiferrobacterales bacterium]